MLSLAGRLGKASASALADAVSAAVTHPNNRVVIDFEGVDYLSSAGIGALREGFASAGGRRVLVVLSGLCEPVRRAMELGGLLNGLRVEDTRESAVSWAVAANDTTGASR